MSKMYDKDLVHVIMEVDKSQHLQWDCRSPRKASGLVPVSVSKPETQESQ